MTPVPNKKFWRKFEQLQKIKKLLPRVTASD